MYNLLSYFNNVSHKKEVLLTLALLLFLHSVPAQYNIRLQTFSSEDGLSQQSVHCMLQDRLGFLWLGTFDGLNKYDGYGFTVTRDGPAAQKRLSHKSVRSIAEDSAGILWIGTSRGLNRLNTLTDEVEQFLHDSTNLNSLCHNTVTFVMVDSRGLVWAGTAKGISILHYPTRKFKHYFHKPDNSESVTLGPVSSIYEDMKGRIWVGTTNGLNCFNSSKGKFKRYQHIPDVKNSLSDNDVRCIKEYREGKLLVGTAKGGLNEFDINTQKFKWYLHDSLNAQTISGNEVSAMTEYSKNVVWIVTNGGLSAFNLETSCFTKLLPLPDKSKRFLADTQGKLLKDREGNIWIAWGNILQKYNPRLQHFGHFKNDPADINSLSNNRVWCIKEDREGLLWIGTLGGGLNRFDRSSNKWKHYRHDPDDSQSVSSDDVLDVCDSRDGTLWITTLAGLDRLDKKTGLITRYNHSEKDPGSVSKGFFLSNVIEDRAGHIWVGTRTGLNRFDRKTEKFEHYNHVPGDTNSLTSDQIRSLLEDRKGNIWVSTSASGLNRLDTATGKFQRFIHVESNSSSINNMVIHCILEDRSGRIWIGGEKGIDCIDPSTGNIIHYLEKDGLPNETVLRMEQDRNGQIWITTNNGIARLDPLTKKFKYFTPSDGLQSRQFSSYCGGQSKRTGELFFGGINGFNIFHPDSIRDHEYKPVVVINKLTKFSEFYFDQESEENMIGRKAVTLSHKDVLSFQFLSISLHKPNNNQYSYQLKGLRNNWIQLGTKREVTFAGLPPGNYTLLVKGSNGDGVWNGIPAELAISILPPWYRTWWFYALCTLTVFALLFLFFQYRLKQKLNVLQIRNRLHRDLHDDVGATLSSVKAYAEILQTDPENKIVSGLIIENAAEMIERLEVIAWAANPLNDNFKCLTDTMLKFAYPITHVKNIKFNLDKDGITDHLLIAGEIRQNIFLIFKEAVNNVIKHAAATQCRVSLLLERTRFILQVEDNGIGHQESGNAGRSGFTNMRKRAEELSGQLEIFNNKESGTVVRLSIPFPFRNGGSVENVNRISPHFGPV